MKKNYFKKLVTSAMMLLTLTVGFTSCEGLFDDVIGEQDRPSEKTPEATYTATDNGASFNINTLADVTNFMNQVKNHINAKTVSGGAYTIDITAYNTLATSSSDNTITLPALSAGYNLVINMKSAINTNAAPLTVKQEGTATTSYKNKIEVTFLNNNVDLVLNLPGTTTTLNNANSLQMKNGLAIVKDGGAIKTYVYGAEKNTDLIYYSHWIISGKDYYGVLAKEREIASDDGSKTYWRSEIYTEKDIPYFFDDVKIVKGDADYSRMNCGDSNHPIKKLTIAADAYAVVNYYPCINTIVGEGDGTAKLGFDDWWWSDTAAKTCANDGNLYQVKNISNLTISEWLPSDIDGTIVNSYLYSVPATENVTFKIAQVNFRNPEAASATVKNCKFESPTKGKRVTITGPYQTSEITSFKFTFESCEFAKECVLYANLVTWKPKYDASGNPVMIKEWSWWNTDGTSWWTNYTQNKDDIPSGLTETTGAWIWDDNLGESVRSTGYWLNGTWQDSEPTTFDNYYYITSFASCKYDGAALTPESPFLDGMNIYDGVFYRFEIDGATYKAVLDSDTNKWLLIPA